MARLGTLTLQALDKSDIFLKEDVFMDGVTDPAELSASIAEPGFDQDKAWVSGSVPKVIPVIVEGDTSVILGWFKGDNYTSPYTIKIYIEYEEADEVELEAGEKE
jgi:hypothetical protein